MGDLSRRSHFTFITINPFETHTHKQHCYVIKLLCTYYYWIVSWNVYTNLFIFVSINQCYVLWPHFITLNLLVIKFCLLQILAHQLVWKHLKDICTSCLKITALLYRCRCSIQDHTLDLLLDFPGLMTSNYIIEARLLLKVSMQSTFIYQFELLIRIQITHFN